MCGSAVCGDLLEEVVRVLDGEERWCFRCRKKRQFEYIVMAPVVDRNDPETWSWYGPSHSIRCSICHKYDSDLFPGNEREWKD